MRLNTFPLLIAQPEQISAHQSSPNTNQYRIVSAERLMSFDPSITVAVLFGGERALRLPGELCARVTMR
jgi:hypothetical protein